MAQKQNPPNAKQQPERRAGGLRARQARIGHTPRLKSYFSNHHSVARISFNRLLQTPIASLMTWAVIGIAIALPMGLYLFLTNIAQLSQGWDRAVQISIFLDLESTEQQGKKLATDLQQRADVLRVKYISREMGLEEFQEFSGFGEAMNYLQSNPLPAVIVVYPKSQDTESVGELLGQLRQMPQVDQVQMDLEWLQRLYSIMSLGRRLVIVIGGLFAAAVLLVIGNTIRLAIEARRAEILVVKLVGGTNGFVRRPFLYAGVWYGLGGGLLATLLIHLVLYWVAGPAAGLIGLYQSEFQLDGMGFSAIILVLVGSALLGWSGAWLAVTRHLDAIEPR